MRRRAFTAALVSAFLLASPGCWDRHEVVDLATVMGMAVDRAKEGGYRLSVQVVISGQFGGAGQAGGQGGQAGTKPVYVLSEKGEDLMDAYRRLQERLPRRLWFADNRVLIIGEAVAREGVTPVIDFFSRQRETRLLSFVAVAPGEGRLVLLAQPPLARVPAEGIRQVERLQTGVAVRMKDFLNTLAAEGADAVAARLEVAPADPRNPQAAGEVRVNGAAVFRGDRLVGWLSDAETRGLLYLRREFRQAVVTVPDPHGDGLLSVEITHAGVRQRPREEGKRIVMDVSVRADGELREVSGAIDLTRTRTIEGLQEALAGEIENRIRATLRKTQGEFGADVLSFGEAVHRFLPTRWKQVKRAWRQEFPRVEVKLSVQARIRRTGMTGRPAMVPESRWK